MSVVDQTITDGIGQSLIANKRVPMLRVKLTGDDCRAHRVAILKDLAQIQTLSRFERRGPEVINDEDLGLGEFSEQTRVAAVSASLE